MGKIIAVWGNPGSGKSTIAGSLAFFLSAKGENVILVDTAISAPQKPIWFPHHDGDFSTSLNGLMSEDNISPASMVKRIFTITDSLGVIGFSKGETPISLSKAQRLDKIKETYKVCSELTDYLIIDCSSNVLDNIYTIVALEQADRVLRVVSPDIKGVVWSLGNLPLVSDAKFASANHIHMTNNVKSFYSVDQIEAAIGDFVTCLPYCLDIELRNISGELFKPFVGRDLLEYKEMLLSALGV